MTRRVLTTVIGLIMLGGANVARASDVLLEMGLHSGGDRFATVLFTSGDSVDINAGELLSLAIGGIVPLNEDMEAQVSIGWKSDGTSAYNGSLSFDRYPVNGLLFFRGANWRIGGGLTYHLSPEVSGSGVGDEFQADFRDAWGTVAEVGYQFDVFYLGGRLTFIDYETIRSSFSSQERFNGDSVGIIFGARF